MSTITSASTLVSQSARVVSTVNGRSRTIPIARSVAPSRASSPPTRRIAVEAKKVQPCSTALWMMVSTIRMSRCVMTRIQPER